MKTLVQSGLGPQGDARTTPTLGFIRKVPRVYVLRGFFHCAPLCLLHLERSPSLFSPGVSGEATLHPAQHRLCSGRLFSPPDDLTDTCSASASSRTQSRLDFSAELESDYSELQLMASCAAADPHSGHTPSAVTMSGADAQMPGKKKRNPI